MNYTVAIRTLGKAGEKYQRLLDSIQKQTIQPHKILIYIAEGYEIPKETIGIEQYIYVRKGMLAQRALAYDEVETDYILFLDDDLELEDNTVELMFANLLNYGLDVIAPDIFDNASRPIRNEIMMMFSGRMLPRYGSDNWGYKVLKSAGYSYKKKIRRDVYLSQTNAGAAFLCKKEEFLKINLKEESWLDEVSYALGDDQVIFYKMYKLGLKVGTWYNHTFKHLDGGQNMSLEKEKKLIYSDFRFKTIFWHRFIFKPEKRLLVKFFSCLAILYTYTFTFLVSVIKGRFDIVKIKYDAIKDGVKYLKSNEYKELPLI